MLLFQNTAVSRSYFCHSNLAQLDTMLTPSRPMGPCRYKAAAQDICLHPVGCPFITT